MQDAPQNVGLMVSLWPSCTTECTREETTQKQRIPYPQRRNFNVRANPYQLLRRRRYIADSLICESIKKVICLLEALEQGVRFCSEIKIVAPGICEPLLKGH